MPTSRASLTYVIWDGNRVVTAVESEVEFDSLPTTVPADAQAVIREAEKLDDEGVYWLVTTLINQRSH